MSSGDQEFAGGDAGAVLMTVIGLVGLLTLSIPAILLPFGVALGVRQVRRHRAVERRLRTEQRERRPDDWLSRVSGRGTPRSRP